MEAEPDKHNRVTGEQLERNEKTEMDKPKRKHKMVPMYSAEDFFSGKKDAKPVGWMSNPDEPGPVVVDRATLERLL